MYEHILLAVALQQGDTPSPHALAARDAAITLARGAGAKLSVLTVFSYQAFVPPALSLEGQGRYRQSQLYQTDTQMRAKMRALFAGSCGAALPITTRFLTGKPGPLIVATAECLGVDLIIIGMHSKRHVLDVLLGGTAAYVSRHALCPVMLAQPSKPQWFLGG
jgi:nucleotide-binding universal stress UspA family protein